MSDLLIFSLTLDGEAGDWMGRLYLIDGDAPHRTIEIYQARSGLPNRQNWNDQDVKGQGPIPREDKAGIPSYSVETKPYDCSGQPGIDGNFYQIHPRLIGNGRSEFGIHRDAGADGSAGCIVLPTESGWIAFERQMARYRQQGISSLPLKICYA